MDATSRRRSPSERPVARDLGHRVRHRQPGKGLWRHTRLACPPGNFPSSSAGVYRSEDGGDTWERANCGLENSRITSIAAGPGVVLAGIESGSPSFLELQGEFFAGGVCRSENRGKCWTRLDLPGEAADEGFWQTRGPSTAGSFITYALWISDPALSAGF